MTSFYVFIILLLPSIFSQSITLLTSTTSQLDTSDNIITTAKSQNDSTTSFFDTTTETSTSTDNITIDSTTTITESQETTLTTNLSSTVSLNITSTNETSVFPIDIISSKSSWRSNWGLLLAVIIVLVALIGIGAFYYQRSSPYRRFLRNWRARDNEADNIILQLEEPEIRNDRWSSRLVFN